MGVARWLTFQGTGQTCMCPWTQGLHFPFPRQVCPKGTWRWPHPEVVLVAWVALGSVCS